MSSIKTFEFEPSGFSDLPFEEKLVALHERLQSEVGFGSVGRVAIASYEEECDRVSVFAFSDTLGRPLRLYSRPLSSVPSLRQLGETGHARVIGDLREIDPSPSQHTIAIRENYRSSLTFPIKRGDKLYGFLFFNSESVDFFTEAVTQRLLPYAQLLSSITVNDLDRFGTIKAAVKTAYDIGNLRDDETAGHLRRMAAYARLIAIDLALRHGLSEHWVDMLEHFAPMHDIGKIAIPDHILLKPGRLDPDELKVMRTHVMAGVTIVDALLNNFRFPDHLFGTMLRNIVACHHEVFDGSGYPHGLSGEAIPIEARIVTVADVFDALTSPRPYKRAWSIDEAMSYLRENAGTKMDPECVGVLLEQRETIERIVATIGAADQPAAELMAPAPLLASPVPTFSPQSAR